jgi:hypothetical protein
MDASLLGSDDFTAVAKVLREDYGTAEDDKLDKNPKLDDFIETFGDANFYTCMNLLVLDPNQEFASMRSNLKMFFLPCFQILVPLGIVWFFLVEEEMIATNGYCCDNSDLIFRFTGFVTFMYSGWQIIDGCDDASSKFFLKKSVNQWALTGQPIAFKATWMFVFAHGSQIACSTLLLIATYVIYTTQCDTPLDLLMNCVAINFVLDIDSEWMDAGKQDKSQKSAEFLFKTFRDACKDDEQGVRKGIMEFKTLRRSAPGLLRGMANLGEKVVWIGAYMLAIGWTFCPSNL